MLGVLVLLATELSGWPLVWALAAGAVTVWGLTGAGDGATHGPTVRLLHGIHAGAVPACLQSGDILQFPSFGAWTVLNVRPYHAHVYGIARSPFAMLDHRSTTKPVTTTSGMDGRCTSARANEPSGAVAAIRKSPSGTTAIVTSTQPNARSSRSTASSRISRPKYASRTPLA